MEGRNSRNNYKTQFYCRHCQAFIPIKYLIKKYGFICVCCKQRVRNRARSRIRQADENYPRGIMN